MLAVCAATWGARPARSGRHSSAAARAGRSVSVRATMRVPAAARREEGSGLSEAECPRLVGRGRQRAAECRPVEEEDSGGEASGRERSHGEDAGGAIRRSGDPAIRRSGDPAIRRSGDPAIRRSGDPAIRRSGDPAIRRSGDPAIRRSGDPAIRRSGDPAYCNSRVIRACQVLARTPPVPDFAKGSRNRCPRPSHRTHDRPSGLHKKTPGNRSLQRRAYDPIQAPSTKSVTRRQTPLAHRSPSLATPGGPRRRPAGCRRIAVAVPEGRGKRAAAAVLQDPQCRRTRRTVHGGRTALAALSYWKELPRAGRHLKGRRSAISKDADMRRPRLEFLCCPCDSQWSATGLVPEPGTLRNQHACQGPASIIEPGLDP